jgi:tellurium resistance protein TerD
LTKGNASLKKILIGLGWDTNKYDEKHDFDLDAAAFCCGEDGKVQNDLYFIFYNNLKHSSDAIEHLGDNLTGNGDGDEREWKFNAIGSGFQGGLEALCKNFGLNV